MKTLVSAALLAATIAMPARAADDMLDLSKPANVVAALQRAGYKAELKKGDDGKPFISSAANGGSFSVDFYDCDKDFTACKSIQFDSWWKKEDFFSNAMINEWNRDKRFLSIYLDKDGNLNENMFYTTVGKVSYENFADAVDWYVSTDGMLTKWLDERRPAKAAAAPATGKK